VLTLCRLHMLDFHDAHALVIGISVYQRVRPLPPVQDAQDVAATLADPARCGYAAANIHVLVEEQATRAAILEALDQLAARTRPSSTAFIYFSGHGGAVPRRDLDTCYLMPVDGRWGDPAELEETAISGAELSRRLRALGASRVTVVLDCCRAAGLAEPKDIEVAPPFGDLTRSSLPPLAPGRAVLAASRANGFAYVTPGQRNGVFTRHLLDGLRGKASAAGGVIRIFDLFHYVQERVAAEQPGQRPVFKAELEENYPIARAPVRAARIGGPTTRGLAQLLGASLLGAVAMYLLSFEAPPRGHDIAFREAPSSPSHDAGPVADPRA
jgi:uncharacterized ParB-like nuclease family protein